METADWSFQKELIEDRLLRWMWRIAAPVLLTFGTLGNILSLVILTVTPAFRGRRGGAVGFALSALCLIDVGVLMTSLVRRCLLHWIGFDFSTMSSLACRCNFFLVHFFSHLSSSTIALLSADRAIIMWSSIPAAGLYGRRRVAVVWTAVATILFAVNLHFFWTAEHLSSSSAVAESFTSGLTTAARQLTIRSEASTVCYNCSALLSTSNRMQPATTSQSDFFLPSLAVLGSSKLPTAKVNPVEIRDLSTYPPPASQWPPSDKAEYCLIARRYIPFYLDVWYWIDLSLWAIAPFFTIIYISF